MIDYQVRVQAGIRRMRKQGLINSYDTVMIVSKEYVFSCERKMDSLDKLILHGKEWQTNKNNRAYAGKVKAMDELFAYNSKLCQQLARMTETSFSEDSIFDAQKEQYTAWNDSLIEENKKLIQTYRSYYSDTRTLKRFHRRAWKRYHKEIGAEFSRVEFTNAMFRGYFGSVSDLMKHNAGKCRKKKGYCRVMRNRLIAEEKKMLKEEAKNN